LLKRRNNQTPFFNQLSNTLLQNIGGINMQSPFLCPYCNKELLEGYIPAGKMALMWIPKGEKMPATIFSKTKNGVNLTDVPLWRAEVASSFYCDHCKVVITPVPKNI